MDNSSQDNAATRRSFMKNSSAAAIAVAGVSGAVSSSAFAIAADKKLKVGLIGCGGRGTGAAQQALLADSNTELVAMGDAFGDRLESSLRSLKGSKVGKRVNVAKSKQFVGLDAYKKVIAECDVVLLTTPPGFRPVQVKAAIEAGKHVFCEKPVATDAPGVRSVMETCRLAKKKKLNLVSGLCYRYERAKIATMDRIADGGIGEIITMQHTYNTSTPWVRDVNTGLPLKDQVRNWLFYTWLSGDHIAEQHIHSLDKMMWLMNDEPPVKVTANGGRLNRNLPKHGNIFDNFSCVFEWKNGVKGFTSCRQYDGNASYDVSDFAYGTKGTAEIMRHRIKAGKTKWQHKKKRNEVDNMYQNEHDKLFESIRKGGVIVNEYMCTSTLAAIMGREAAYSGKTITWDQMMNSKMDLVPNPIDLTWNEAPNRPVRIPGRYQLK